MADNPDLKLIVGADVSKSVKAFQDDIKEIVKELEKSPPKIKVDIDDKSTKDAAKKIKDALKDAMDEKSTTSYNNALKSAYNLQNQLTSATQKYSGSLGQMSSAGRQAAQTTRDLNNGLQQTIDDVRNGSKDVQDLKNAVSETGAAFAESKTHLTGYYQTLQQIGQYFGRYLSIGALIQQMRQLISTSIEMNSTFTQMQIVTKATDSEMREFGNTAAEIAQKVGASIADVVDSATTFARLGYTMNESATLAEFTTMLQNVGDIDTQSAQDAITAIIKAFSDEIDISNIETVMDKLVTVGK